MLHYWQAAVKVYTIAYYDLGPKYFIQYYFLSKHGKHGDQNISYNIIF